jgi:hypothetical protein
MKPIPLDLRFDFEQRILSRRIKRTMTTRTHNHESPEKYYHLLEKPYLDFKYKPANYQQTH